jgi:hypothetical protein
MTTIGTSSLYSGTINGLNSLDLDTLNVTDLDVNNIDGDFFSINTIECNDLQVDNEIDLTTTGFITIGKNTPTEITITDTELGFLDGVSSNIEGQLNAIRIGINSIASDVITLEQNTQNLTATSTTNTFLNSTTNFKDAPVDETITNKLSSFTYFDTNIALMRTASEYRKFWIGMTGNDEDPTNRFAIGCNGVNLDQPEILMEIDATGEISMRNGLKIFDLQGNNVGTINNFSDSPTSNSTFSIRTLTGNLFLQSDTLIDAWTPSLSIGQTRGSTLTMRSDAGYTEDEVYYPPTYKSRIILNDLTLFGGLGNVANDASIELNGETQNHAYTDADHLAVNGIGNLETAVTTNTTNIGTNTSAILALGTDVQTNINNIFTNEGNIQLNYQDITTNTTNISNLTTSFNTFSSSFKGGSYKMPFNAFNSTNGSSSTPLSNISKDCFRIIITPNWSRNDLIYLKVCMRHQTTFNNTASPFTQQSLYRGYYDGVWILSPKECCAPIRRGGVVLSNPNDTGNPISGGGGYGVNALDTSDSINTTAHLFYQEAGSIIDGLWSSAGNPLTSNPVITFYMSISTSGVCSITFRYLGITTTGSNPSTRNQSISGTIEILQAVNTSTSGTGYVQLQALNSNGGMTFNSGNTISSV